MGRAAPRLSPPFKPTDFRDYSIASESKDAVSLENHVREDLCRHTGNPVCATMDRMGEMTLWSAALLLFLVMDPVGNVPIFVSVLGNVEPARRGRIVFREMLIALAILLAFLFAGQFLLHLMGISEAALEIAGGILLFLIAIKMVFPQGHHQGFEDDFGGEPLIVPLAVPMVAGPSAIATVLVILGRDPGRWPEWLVSLLVAWSASCIILVSAAKLSRRLGKRGLIAMERLMGMIVVAIGVEMIVRGVRTLAGELAPAVQGAAGG